jgi:hypothetical protein
MRVRDQNNAMITPRPPRLTSGGAVRVREPRLFPEAPMTAIEGVLVSETDVIETLRDFSDSLQSEFFVLSAPYIPRAEQSSPRCHRSGLTTLALFVP